MGSAHVNPLQTFQCALQFVACAKSKCDTAVEVTAVSNDDIIEKMKQCKEANDKCMAQADGIKAKAFCCMCWTLSAIECVVYDGGTRKLEGNDDMWCTIR